MYRIAIPVVVILCLCYEGFIQRPDGYTVILKVWHDKAVGSGLCQPIRPDQYTPCKIPYLHKCTFEWNKQQITLLIWLLDLVSFCYYTVVDKNCIQADAKLSATHAINCTNISKVRKAWFICYCFTHIYATIQVVILARHPVRSLVTCLFIDCMYKWNCLHPWWNFCLHRHILCSNVPTRWGPAVYNSYIYKCFMALSLYDWFLFILHS